MRSLFILRGIPGSGKSTVAKEIAGTNGVVCEADSYFVGDDGMYRFDAKKLGLAHGWCGDCCENAMAERVHTIVVSNTNIDLQHFAKYEDLAAQYGYRVFHLVVENRHGGTNQHGVPKHTLVSMREKLKNSIELGLG